MKKIPAFLIILAAALLSVMESFAQCSVCTKTAQQLGEKPAIGLNNGILYLMAMPLLIIGIIAYRWWKSDKHA